MFYILLVKPVQNQDTNGMHNQDIVSNTRSTYQYINSAHQYTLLTVLPILSLAAFVLSINLRNSSGGRKSPMKCFP